MRSRSRLTLRTFLVGLAAGAVLAYAVQLARRSPAPSRDSSETPPPVPVGRPAPPSSSAAVPSSPVPATETSPAPSAGERVRAETVDVELELPSGYRVAQLLNAHDASRPGPRQFTITKASRGQEEEYLALIRDLQTRGVATEAPEFSPGQTIRFTRFSGSSDEAFAAQLAKEKRQVTNASGLSGTRYRRVEGLFPYDATYVSLGGGKTVAVLMSYAAADPTFDDESYTAVLNSMRALPE